MSPSYDADTDTFIRSAIRRRYFKREDTTSPRVYMGGKTMPVADQGRRCQSYQRDTGNVDWGTNLHRLARLKVLNRTVAFCLLAVMAIWCRTNAAESCHGGFRPARRSILHR